MVTCPTCGSELHYRATISAPGHGQSWECESGHSFVKLGSTLIDTNADFDGEPPWILSIEDVR